MKEPDYVTKIMASWMTLDELEDEKTRRKFIDINGKKETKKFMYREPFDPHFRYRHQLYDHKTWIYATIYLYITWVTKFWPDQNFYWYHDVSEVNTDLASGNFQNDGVVQLSL